MTAFGVEPLINACGIYTDLGGSCLSPAVWAAATQANSSFGSLPDLLDRSGELIAELVGAPAARVVPGASAGIALGVAACIAGQDGQRMELLPRTDDAPNEVVMQRGHRYKYARCATLAGGAPGRGRQRRGHQRGAAAGSPGPVHRRDSAPRPPRRPPGDPPAQRGG